MTNTAPEPKTVKVEYASVLHEFYASIKRVGIRNSLFLTYSRLVDLLFDWRYGFDTSARVELNELSIESDNLDHGSPYQPTGVQAFKKIMGEIHLPEPSIAIDYGSGKGRVLLLAALAGFSEITGVEFSEELCKTARENLIQLKKKRPQHECDCKVVCCDATQFKYSDQENIFYFFYSFDDDLMEKVIAEIDKSLTRAPREALLIDLNPFSEFNLSPVISKSSLFEKVKSIDIYGYQCNYYKYTP